jgi:basic amino acid/polyamine antiporter, APA family
MDSLHSIGADANEEYSDKCGNCFRDVVDSLRQKKPVERSIEQNNLPRLLSWYDLCTYGISATVGSGIFVISGTVAKHTGPSIIVSIFIAGLASLITGFCYLEFASRIPTSGSAYVYVYTSLGELMGWFIGWNLTLEYSIAAAAIASSWGNYVVILFQAFGITIPKGLYRVETGWSFCKINVLALLIVLFVTVIILIGLKSSAWFNNIITMINVSAIVLVVVAGCFYVDKKNWEDFFPSGFTAVMGGAATIFFSYIGFDTVCTLTSETRRPRRDIPIAVIVTVSVATLLYISVGIVLTGMVFYQKIDENAPLAEAFLQNQNYWATKVIAICSVTTMTATMLACLLGQPRIFYSMAQDGLIPPAFTILKNHTPIVGVLFSSLIAGGLGFLFNVDALSQMVSLGTLLAFAVVCCGLIVLRLRQSGPLKRVGSLSVVCLFFGNIITWIAIRFSAPIYISILLAVVGILFPNIVLLYIFIKYRADLCQVPVGFACPLVPVLPALAILANTYLMMQLSQEAYISFAVWAGLGLIIYFSYGIRHSALRVLRIASFAPLRKIHEKESVSDDDPTHGEMPLIDVASAQDKNIPYVSIDDPLPDMIPSSVPSSILKSLPQDSPDSSDPVDSKASLETEGHKKHVD